MKNITLISTVAILSMVTASTASAASAAVNFSSPPYGADLSPIDGVDGWTQSESNTAPDAPMFFVSDQGGNNFGYLSGLYATPDSPPFSVSRDFALPSTTLLDSTLIFEAAIVDSSLNFPERDNFGMTVNVGGVDLLTLTLTPESQTGSSNWAIEYLFNGGSTLSSGYAAVPNSLVTYEIYFTATGLDVKFGAGGVSTSFSGTPTGYNPASTSDIKVGFFWHKGPGTDFGDNGLLIDNIDVVPEPASSSLLLLGIVGIVLRRRR